MRVDALAASAVAARPQRPETPVPQGPPADRLPARPAPEQDPTAAIERLRAVVSEINRALQAAKRQLAFSVDEASGRTIVRVIDAATGEVLRQIPSEEALQLTTRLAATGSPTTTGLEQWS